MARTFFLSRLGIAEECNRDVGWHRAPGSVLPRTWRHIRAPYNAGTISTPESLLLPINITNTRGRACLPVPNQSVPNLLGALEGAYPRRIGAQGGASGKDLPRWRLTRRHQYPFTWNWRQVCPAVHPALPLITAQVQELKSSLAFVHFTGPYDV